MCVFFEIYKSSPYIKIGQILGQLDQLVPSEYIKAFEPMCMAAPRTKYEDIESIIKEELGKGIDEDIDVDVI